MRINRERKSVDIEERDIEFIFPAYIRSYMFYSQNEEPEKIIFPMFKSAPHPLIPGTRIPIEYVPVEGEVAQEIAEDGSNIPIPSPEDLIRQQEESGTIGDTPPTEPPKRPSIEEAMGTKVADVSVAPNVTIPDRKPKMPEHPASEGTLSDMAPRDRRDQKRVARDIAPQPDVDEGKEKPTEIEKPEEQ